MCANIAGADRSRSRRLRLWIFFLVPLFLLSVVWLTFEIAVRNAVIPGVLMQPVIGTPVLTDHRGQPLARIATPQARMQVPVPLHEMAPWLAKATLALEDKRFYQHRGVDWLGILAAMQRNLRAGKVLFGGSTLTQQLVKRANPPGARTLSVKWREICVATAYERKQTKAQILERYLNTVDYGNRLVGVEAAAQSYFGRSALHLTPQQSLFLAGLPQAPSLYNPWSKADSAAARYRLALRSLVHHGILTSNEALEWEETPRVQKQSSWPGEIAAPHFVAQAKARMKGQGSPSGEPIATCLDLQLQQQVRAIVSRHLQRLSHAGVDHASAVVLDHRTGAVRAWIGSGGWHKRDGQMDGVVTPRSAGSTLKPFLYLHALDQRIITAATLLPDTPDAVRSHFPDYDPRNYDERFWGPVRVREALANSLNVPAVVTLARLGPRHAARLFQDCGITFARGFDTYGAGLILGNAEVRLLDLAAAYGLFANRGHISKPRLFEGDPERHHSLAQPESVAVLTDILSDNNARRKTFGPQSPLAFQSSRIPCKTGTSSGFRDAWTLGMTGQHVVGVWMGNFSGQPMREVASVTGPAPLWREIVELLLQTDSDVPNLLPTLKVESHEICRLTGLLPVELSPGKELEWFVPGTAPTADAEAHFRTKSDGDGVQVLLPENYSIWCGSTHNYLGAMAIAKTLSIAQPRDGAVFELDPHLPLERQQLEMIAITVDPQSSLKWRLNGEDLPVNAVSKRLFWPLQAGAHKLEVSDGTRWAGSSFTVR